MKNKSILSSTINPRIIVLINDIKLQEFILGLSFCRLEVEGIKKRWKKGTLLIFPPNWSCGVKSLEEKQWKNRISLARILTTEGSSLRATKFFRRRRRRLRAMPFLLFPCTLVLAWRCLLPIAGKKHASTPYTVQYFNNNAIKAVNAHKIPPRSQRHYETDAKKKKRKLYYGIIEWQKISYKPI